MYHRVTYGVTGYSNYLFVLLYSTFPRKNFAFFKKPLDIPPKMCYTYAVSLQNYLYWRAFVLNNDRLFVIGFLLMALAVTLIVIGGLLFFLKYLYDNFILLEVAYAI